jgi:hypothetical protein
MKITIWQVSKCGMEIWEAKVNGEVVAQAWSRNGILSAAKSYIIKQGVSK